MEIKKHNKIYNPNFGIHIKRESVLEAASGSLFYHKGIEGYRDVFLALSDKKFTGRMGFKGYAIELGKQINAKYPQIEKAANEIKEILKSNSKIAQNEPNKEINQILNRFEPYIDISI